METAARARPVRRRDDDAVAACEEGGRKRCRDAEEAMVGGGGGTAAAVPVLWWWPWVASVWLFIVGREGARRAGYWLLGSSKGQADAARRNGRQPPEWALSSHSMCYILFFFSVSSLL